MQRAGVLLHGFLFEDAQDVQRGGFGAADVAGAGAARAGDVAGFGERGTQALARQFEQAETADLAGLDAGAVEMQPCATGSKDFRSSLRPKYIHYIKRALKWKPCMVRRSLH